MNFAFDLLKGMVKTLLALGFLVVFALFLGVIVYLIYSSFSFGFRLLGAN